MFSETSTVFFKNRLYAIVLIVYRPSRAINGVCLTKSTLTFDLDFQSPVSYGHDPHTSKNEGHRYRSAQSCPWVELTHELGWVGLD